MILGSVRSSRSTVTATFLLGVALILSGCKHAAAPAAGVRNSDGSITNADGSITYPAGTLPSAPVQTPTQNADGSITNPDGSVTYPAGSTRAQKAQQSPAPQAVQTQTPPPPVQQAQQAPPPPPAPVERVIRSGTEIPVTTTETLSASRNNAGDTFTGVLRRSVVAPGGAVVFARGTQVSGVVAAAKGKGRFKGAGDLAIELTRIGGTRVSTTEYEAANKGRGKRTAGFVGGGGGLGALIGGIAGGGKGALIGGLAGAGAGTAGAAYTGSRDVVIPSESAITFRLTEPVTIR
jgi:hypothetical protein